MENETEASRRLQRVIAEDLEGELPKGMFQEAEAETLHDKGIRDILHMLICRI